MKGTVWAYTRVLSVRGATSSVTLLKYGTEALVIIQLMLYCACSRDPAAFMYIACRPSYMYSVCDECRLYILYLNAVVLKNFLESLGIANVDYYWYLNQSGTYTVEGTDDKKEFADTTVKFFTCTFVCHFKAKCECAELI